MTKNYVLFFCFSFLCSISVAQEIKLVSGNLENLVLKNTTPDYISAQKFDNGIAYEDFSAVSKILMMQKDAPALPMFSESLIIPDTGDFSVQVSFDSYVEIENVLVMPSKGSLKRNVIPADVPLAFGPAYSQDNFFPGSLAQAGNPYIFRKTRGVTIAFYPYQYNPVSQKLRVYKNITVSVIPNQQPGANERQSISPNVENAFFNSAYSNHYANMPAYNPITEEGEMLIITPENYSTAIAAFYNWKVEEGMKTTVVTLTETGSTAASIKDFIANFYAENPNLTYVQLVGDHQQLPCFTYGSSGSEQLWSDSYFGQIDGDDFYPELMVGRFSGTVEEVQLMVSRTLEYETNPHSGDWMTNAIGIGSNEGDGIGDDGEPDWQHLRNIGDKLTDFGYNTIYEFYDGSHGGNDEPESPPAETISTAINLGVGLLNYTGHGAQDIMVTGEYTSDEVNVLQNDGKYPFVISVACNNGTFTNGTSLCESFMRVFNTNSPAGSIATCGSSILMAWAEPMQTQDEMTELIIRSDSDNVKSTLGGLFYNGQISMLEEYGESQTAEEVMQTWVFFGDPSTLFRSQVSTEIIANHESEMINDGLGVLHVTTNTNGARVAITHNNEIIAVAQTADGIADIAIPEMPSLENLKVTLTKPNTVPYRGAVELLPSLGIATAQNIFSVYPNPASDVVHIYNTGNATGNTDITITDMNGRILLSELNVSVATTHSVSTTTLSAGIYILSVRANHVTQVCKVIIR